VGWRVHDLQGRFHFLRDVIFNEASTGRRLCLPCSIPAPLPAERPSHPSRQRILDLEGEGLAESLDSLHLVHLCNSSVAPSHGGDPVRCSSRIAARSALVAFDRELLVVDVLSFTAVFPGSPDSTPISLVSLEPDALAFVTLPPDRHWNLSKEPQSFAEACAQPDAAVWHAAMKRELASLREMDTFAECPLPPGKKPLALKWVFAYKMNPDGSRALQRVTRGVLYLRLGRIVPMNFLKILSPRSSGSVEN